MLARGDGRVNPGVGSCREHGLIKALRRTADVKMSPQGSYVDASVEAGVDAAEADAEHCSKVSPGSFIAGQALTVGSALLGPLSAMRKRGLPVRPGRASVVKSMIGDFILTDRARADFRL